ncbi:BQ2448_5150 [Microbotryum intermedium]|uniref:BQ2448_5150 protein n=1 Tax=Microbotryum intermedium TaxID=269621 RepID=A0A238F4B0_9BASI|nr:BQ2448_5150 [Microbotryum intermedium]
MLTASPGEFKLLSRAQPHRHYCRRHPASSSDSSHTGCLRLRSSTDHSHSTKKDGLVFSNIDGVGYRKRLVCGQDFTVSSTSRFKSRSRLDAIAYDQLERQYSETVLFCVPSLSSVCVQVAARNWLKPGIFGSLDCNFHRDRAPEILEAIASQSEIGLLPFNVFVDFATVLSTDMPKRRRTYRGLCRTDHNEIRQLDAANERARIAWQTDWTTDEQQQAISGHIAAPCFFLAVLDLGGTSFSDQDIIALKDPLANFLAVLKLRSTHVTDDGLAWIARAFAHDKRSYRHLQVLSLCSLSRVTNSGVQHLAALPLRMLDVRGTACTPQLRFLLNTAVVSLARNAEEPRRAWRCAIAKRVALEMQGLSSSLELELFSSINYSPARTLALLHRLGEIQLGDTCQAHRLPKSIVVHIDAISRRSDAEKQNDHAGLPKIRIGEDVDMGNGPRYARYSSVYGIVTSTSGVSQEALLSSVNSEPEARGAAFRVRDDAIAGHGSTPKNTSSSAESGARQPRNAELDPLSDSEDEGDCLVGWDHCKSERLRALAQEQATILSFHQRTGPQERRPSLVRTIAVPPRSDLMLIRHLPVVTPLACQAFVHNTYSPPSGPPSDDNFVVDEGDLIRPKKRHYKDGCEDVLLPGFSRSRSTSRASATAGDVKPALSTATTRSKRPRSKLEPANANFGASRLATPGPATLPRNPFAKMPSKIGDFADNDAPFELALKKPAKHPRF